MGAIVMSAQPPTAREDRVGQQAGDRLEMPPHVGLVLPVHDEERLLPAALAALERAIDDVPDAHSESIDVVVVLDGCTDRSQEIAEEWCRRVLRVPGKWHIDILETDVKCVGEARRLGCQALLDRWSEIPPEDIWLMTTDADSEVPRDWVTAQLQLRRTGCQVWAGPVAVRDWSDRAPGTADAWLRRYAAEALPVHGANFGIDAHTYLAAGGFPGQSTAEDRDLFDRAVAIGAAVRSDPMVQVITSSRRVARAPEGFARALTSIESTLGTGTRARKVRLDT
jgi:Glycosyl transferase family 2